jgi:hypothetical protein
MFVRHGFREDGSSRLRSNLNQESIGGVHPLGYFRHSLCKCRGSLDEKPEDEAPLGPRLFNGLGHLAKSSHILLAVPLGKALRDFVVDSFGLPFLPSLWLPS